ncbi:site-specific integrase [Spirillospora sp. NBC_00431]
MLRATAATLLLDAGVPVEVVQQPPAHASPVTTQRYNHGTSRLDAHGTYRLAALLAGGT